MPLKDLQETWMLRQLEQEVTILGRLTPIPNPSPNPNPTPNPTPTPTPNPNPNQVTILSRLNHDNVIRYIATFQAPQRVTRATMAAMAVPPPALPAA